MSSTSRASSSRPQGLALEIDKALDEEAVDTRHLLHQLNTLDDEAPVTTHFLGQPNNALVDEAAVTSHLLGQPNNVHDDQAAVISHLLDLLPRMTATTLLCSRSHPHHI